MSTTRDEQAPRSTRTNPGERATDRTAEGARGAHGASETSLRAKELAPAAVHDEDDTYLLPCTD